MWKFLFQQKQKIKLTKVCREEEFKFTFKLSVKKRTFYVITLSIFIHVDSINIIHSEHKVYRNPSA